MLKTSNLDVLVRISETKSPRIVKERPHIAFYDPLVDKMFSKKFHLNTGGSDIRPVSSFVNKPTVFYNKQQSIAFSKRFQLVKTKNHN